MSNKSIPRNISITARHGHNKLADASNSLLISLGFDLVLHGLNAHLISVKSRLYTLTGGAEHFSISLALWYLMILATIGNKRLFLGRCATHMTELYASFRLNYLSHLRRRFDDISTYYKAQSSESEVRAISLQDSYNKGTRQDDRSKKYLGLS